MHGLDLGSIYAHIKADTVHFVAGMQGAVTTAKSTALAIERAGLRMTKAMAAIGAAVTVMSAREFAKFDDAMVKSTAIMGNLSEQTKRQMRDIAIALSRHGVQSAEQLARSYFYLASAGLDAERSMAALPVVQQFATAGAFDMARATDLVTDAQSALGLTVKDAATNMVNMTRVADVLVKANVLANASTEQFSQALTSQAGPAMKAYGVSLEEGVAVLAAYADQGIKAENAGNMFSRFLRLMTKSFEDSRAAWDKFNLTIYDSTGMLRPLSKIIDDLTAELGGLSTEQKVAALGMLGFEARSQQAILPLLGLGGAIAAYEGKLREAGGTTQDVSDKQLKSFGNQLRIVWNNVKAVGIMFGSIVAEAGPAIQGFFEDLSGWLMDNEENFRKWAHAVVNAIKQVADYAIDIQTGLAALLPNGVTAVSKDLADFEYKLTMERQGRPAYSAPAFKGYGFGGGFDAQVRTDEKLYQDILARVKKDNERTANDVRNSWGRGYKAATDTAETSFKSMKAASKGAVTLPGSFPTDLVDGLEEVSDSATVVVDKLSAYRVMLSEMGRVSEDVFNFQLKQLEELAKSYQDAGVAASTVNKWLREQNDLLEIERLKQGDVADGFRAYALAAQRAMKTAGEKAFEFASSMESAISQGLQNMIRDFDNWQDHLKGIFEEIYYEVLRIALIQPMAQGIASSLSGAMGSFFSGGVSTNVGQTAEPGLNYYPQPVPTGLGQTAEPGLNYYPTGLAEGAVAMRPMITSIAENEPELVMPLSKLGQLGGKVEIHNYTGTPIDTSNVHFDPDRMITNVVLKDKRNRGPIHRASRRR